MAPVLLLSPAAAAVFGGEGRARAAPLQAVQGRVRIGVELAREWWPAGLWAQVEWQLDALVRLERSGLLLPQLYTLRQAGQANVVLLALHHLSKGQLWCGAF